MSLDRQINLCRCLRLHPFYIQVLLVTATVSSLLTMSFCTVRADRSTT